MAVLINSSGGFGVLPTRVNIGQACVNSRPAAVWSGVATRLYMFPIKCESITSFFFLSLVLHLRFHNHGAIIVVCE